MALSKAQHATAWALLLSTLTIVCSSAFVTTNSVLRRRDALMVQRESDDDDIEIFIPLESSQEQATSTNKNMSDDGDEFKRTRVLIYMGVSLLPILALIPFMSGRDFVPVDPSAFS